MLAEFVGRLMQNFGGHNLDVRNDNEEMEQGRHIHMFTIPAEAICLYSLP